MKRKKARWNIESIRVFTNIKHDVQVKGKSTLNSSKFKILDTKFTTAKISESLNLMRNMSTR